MATSRASNPAYEGLNLYRRLLQYVTPHKLAIYGSLLGFLLFAAMAPASAWWLGLTIDAIETENSSQLRILSPLLCVGIVLLRGIGGFLGSYSLASLSNRLVHKLRCELIDHLLNLPAEFFDKQSSGKLVSKFTYDITQITGAATNAVVVLIREGLTVIYLLAFLLYIDWLLSITFLVIAPFVGWIVSIASRRFRRYATQMQDSMGDVTQVTNETIKGLRIVRTFNAETYVSEKMGTASEKNRRQNMKMALTRSASTPLVQLIVSLAMALLVWLAMAPEFFADKSAGDFVAFLGAAGLLAKPIRQLTQVNSVIQRGLSAAYSVFSLLDQHSESDLGSHTVGRARGEIRFTEVSFSYSDGTQALKDISFAIAPGQTVALVGRSGSGKTSLVNLIPRFYDYQSGLITLDDVPLSDYTLKSLREQISLVSQQVVLFNGTVAENIAYGEADIDMARVEEAARNAHALEFIEDLSEGLATQVGDDASSLSGGQRQRLAIARALLKDAPVLILDEATSALDTESEQYIQEALKRLIKGRTTFVIAHRLSTIESADLILVMDQGRIVESGSHTDLLANNGHYAKLHKLQFSDDATAIAP